MRNLETALGCGAVDEGSGGRDLGERMGAASGDEGDGFGWECGGVCVVIIGRVDNNIIITIIMTITIIITK